MIHSLVAGFVWLAGLRRASRVVPWIRPNTLHLSFHVSISLRAGRRLFGWGIPPPLTLFGFRLLAASSAVSKADIDSPPHLSKSDLYSGLTYTHLAGHLLSA